MARPQGSDLIQELAQSPPIKASNLVCSWGMEHGSLNGWSEKGALAKQERVLEQAQWTGNSRNRRQWLK